MSVRSCAIALAAAALALGAAGASGVAAESLDYNFFKQRVEPVFLDKRPSHGRCYSCHSQASNALHLERLSPGEKFWTEDQSRKNFAAVSQLVLPDQPDTSPLLLHPLAPEAGGDAFHSGGRQFASKSDPNWKILSAWAHGAKLGAK